MSHRILLSTVALLLVGATYGQVELRPHLGINTQNITKAPDGTQWQGKAGYTFGGHVLIGTLFFFQPGIQYVKSRILLSKPTTGFSPTQTNTLETAVLRLPVVVGYRFSDPSDKPAVNFRMFGGMVANFLFSSAFVDYGHREVGKSSFALTAGAGLDFGIFFIDFSYDIGLTEVFDEDEVTLDGKSNLTQLNAGIRLNLSK